MITKILSKEDWINIEVAVNHGLDYLEDQKEASPEMLDYYTRRVEETKTAIRNLVTGENA